MAGFTAPIDPAGWTLEAAAPLTVPPGLRYAGARLPTLRATRAAPAAVHVPAAGTLRHAGDVVQVEVSAFRHRDVAAAIPGGLPTFYFAFDPGTTLVPFADGYGVEAGDQLASVTAVSILCAAQDRVARDPALWARQIAEAHGAGSSPSWDAFAAALTGGAEPPVLLLDHTGALLAEGSVEIHVATATATATFTAADGGDLQRVVARLHAADPAQMPLASVFAAGAPVTLRPASPGTTDFQLAVLEDAAHAQRAVDVSPARRHVTLTDLRAWLAPQFAGPKLKDYTRGNTLTPFVNGKPYFTDLFHRVQEAARAGDGGLHLVGGWKTFPEDELADREDPPADGIRLPVSIAEAAQLLADHGGATRVLSPQFIQLDPGSPVETAEIIVVSTVIGALLAAQNIDVVRSDAAGAVILVALFALNTIAVTWIIDSDGRVFEPNKDALDVLNAIPSTVSRLAPHPATVADNPASPPLAGFPYDSLIKLIRHFGFYHTKFAIVGAADARYGYCGGIDINPNRLDDARHLQAGPYHDVHTKVEGPAVRDLELTFQERWKRDGGGTGLAFDPMPDGSTGDGTDVVQIARTYFAAADPSRALDFARNGDRTIFDTMLAAIAQAREFIYIEDQYFTPPEAYRNALLRKVEQREIGSLVIVLPSTPDQPFGEIVREPFVAALRAADAGAGIVRVGYPRRHFTTPDNELRASSGRLLLFADLDASGGVNPTVVLGPKARLPQPPFWFAVEGELMYAYNESTSASPDPGHARVFEVVRGPDTRLYRGGDPATALGPRTRVHKAGAAATVVDLAGIYVHAKMMIVDDVFVGIGSANINRRGLCHDGEIAAFSVPQQLKASPGNPVAALRRELWAEMLDLPASAKPLLEDPIAAARLFDRSPALGNRFTGFGAHPTHLMFDATGADGVVLDLLRLLLVDQFVLVDHVKMFDAVVDPTSAVES